MDVEKESKLNVKVSKSGDTTTISWSFPEIELNDRFSKESDFVEEASNLLFNLRKHGKAILQEQEKDFDEEDVDSCFYEKTEEEELFFEEEKSFKGSKKSKKDKEAKKEKDKKKGKKLKKSKKSKKAKDVELQEEIQDDSELTTISDAEDNEFFKEMEEFENELTGGFREKEEIEDVDLKMINKMKAEQGVDAVKEFISRLSQEQKEALAREVSASKVKRNR